MVVELFVELLSLFGIKVDIEVSTISLDSLVERVGSINGDRNENPPTKQKRSCR